MPIINQVVAGSGGSAPAHYIEKSVDANGVLQSGSHFIDLTGVTEISQYCLYCAYQNNTQLSGAINMGSVTTIQTYGCFKTLTNSTNITAVDLSSLTTIQSSGCSSMFDGCTSLTGPVDLSSLTTIQSSGCTGMFKGTKITSIDLSLLTLIPSYGGQEAFKGCGSLTSVNLSSLTTIDGGQATMYMFQNCTALTTVNLSSLKNVWGYTAARYMFQGCTSITSVDLSSLTNITGQFGCDSMFSGCTSITSADLSSLTNISAGSACAAMFSGCTNLTVLSFPSITNSSFGTQTNLFNSLCYQIPSITLHFPSNTQAKIESLTGYSTTAPFGAISGTVLFDLPATYTLTGADSNTYSRNPKYDTATSLAWKVGAYGTTNFTPAYYTSGTTDPAVSDTIYSDAACTQSVTTITAIA